MNSRSKSPEIRKEVFTQAREKLGLNVKELAGRACLSARQIEQIENGEMNAFYGAQIKLTAAKKVANILGLTEAEAFDHFESATSDIHEADKKTEQEAGQTSVKTTPVKNSSKEAQTQSVLAASESVVAHAIPSSHTPHQKFAKKRLLIWGALIASLVFLGLNLHPLFFKAQPIEVVEIKEEVIEPPAEIAADSKAAPTLPVASNPAVETSASLVQSAIASSVAEICPSVDAVVPSYRPPAPKKAGDMVYMQTKNKQVICVIDASGKSQSKTIEPGLGASFYGKPPFKVLTSGLAQVDIYYQGAKVRPDNADGKTIFLEAGEITQPAAPQDAVLR